MAGKVLRLGFAMGGGVSLGTFAGGALTETIKWAVLLAGEDGPYDDVLIDGFSGASAGALSLGLMARGLAERSVPQQNAARRALLDSGMLKPGTWERLAPRQKRQLIAAQHAQRLQEQAWVEMARMHRFLGYAEADEHCMGPAVVDLRDEPGLLQRNVTFEIVREIFEREHPGTQFRKRVLLADRVLFACTLANLSPMVFDSEEHLPESEEARLGLTDYRRMRIHQDYRIFDLFFSGNQTPSASYDSIPTPASVEEDQHREYSRFPKRWFRLCESGNKIEMCRGDLKQQQSWEKIAATAIACGAFPFAFEPVNLKRHEWEYSGRIWRDTFRSHPGGRPSCANFAYTDGGTFNNEPLREAFRLANFIDSQAGPEEEFDRLIVFVDPWVSNDRENLNAPHLKKFFLEKTADMRLLQSIARKASLDRLIPNAISLIGGIRNQAKVNEIDKAREVRQLMSMREEAQELLKGGLSNTPSVGDLNTLKNACRGHLKREQQDALIPTNTLTLACELARVFRETSSGRDPIPALEDIEAFCRETHLGGFDPAVWQHALACIYVDLGLGLGGKSLNSKPLVITAFEATSSGVERINLQGRYFNGFAGFMSKEAASHDFEVGRLRAQRVWSRYMAPPSGYGLTDITPPNGKFSDTLRVAVEKNQVALAKRVGRLVQDAQTPGTLFEAVMALSSRFLRKHVEDLKPFEERRTFEFRILLEEQAHEKWQLDSGIREQGLGPREDEDGQPCLITFLDEVTDTSSAVRKWEGGGLVKRNNTYKLIVQKNTRLWDRQVASIALPTRTVCDASASMINPVFEAKSSQIAAGEHSAAVWGHAVDKSPDHTKDVFG